MTYRFDGFHGRALYELNGLPGEIHDALVERVLELLETPWDAVAERPGQSVIRHAFFGKSGEGMLTILVDDESETLRITDIVWIG